MKLLNNLKVGAKLGLGFGVCIFLGFAIALIAIRGMSSMDGVSRRITTDALQGTHDLGAIDSSLLKARSDYFQVFYSSKSASREKLETAADKEVSDIKEGMDRYGTSITSPEDSKNFDQLKGFMSSIFADISTLKGLSNSNTDQAAKTLFNGKMAGEFDGAATLVDQMFEWNNTHGQNLTRESEQTYRSARSSVVVLGIISVLCGIWVCVYVTRFIVRHIKVVATTMESLRDRCVTGLANSIRAMESGDLTVEVVAGTSLIDVKTSEEFGKLSEVVNGLLEKMQAAIGSFGKSQNSLSTLVLDLQAAARNVSDTASSLAGTSQEVEAAAEEIGESMREVSSATEQTARGATEVAAGTATQATAISAGSDQLKTLVEAVHSVAADADSAARSVDEATQVATEGGAVVSQSVEGMQLILVAVQESAEVIQELGKSSEKIGTIVQTIEEIAGQTNLRALNAAIEAARAGEAGRGFAVVADEVRKLAERSGSATREIATLISDIQTTTLEAVRSMESGMSGVKTQAKLAEDTGEAFEKIQKAFESVTNQVQRISAATENMTSASDEVSHAISDAAAVIEESSAAAEELSASSEEVSASIQTVASSTHQQVAAVRDLVTSSENLSDLARTLQQSVSQFKPKVEESSRQHERKLHLLSA